MVLFTVSRRRCVEYITTYSVNPNLILKYLLDMAHAIMQHDTPTLLHFPQYPSFHPDCLKLDHFVSMRGCFYC